MKHLFFIFLTLITTISFSQKPVTILKIPTKYLNDNNGEVVPSTAERDDIRNWIVASDRDANKTYADKSGSTEFKTMSFLDCFWVGEDNGDFIHIFKLDPNEFQLEESSARKKGKPARLIKGINDYGWAPKSKMLLWFKSKVNERRLSQRALPVLKQENLTDASFKVNNGVIQLFKNPELSILSEKQVKMFQFLYVYKVDPVNSTYLVGVSYKTTDRQIQNELLGWIHPKILQEWGDRICLEPNWNSDAVAKRKSLNIKTSIFTDPSEAVSSQSGGGSAKPAWNNDPFELRMGPNEKRFPILQSNVDNKPGIVKTGFVTALLNGDKVVETSKEHAEEAKLANINMLEKRKINFVLVVDGSKGMEEYITAAKNSIAKLQERIEKDKKLEDPDDDPENHFNYKFGVVVYRDMEDKGCSEDLSVSVSPLNVSSSDAINFLDDQSKKVSCNTSGKSTGALHSGLYRALRMFKETENFDKQTNVMIVIGSKDGGETDPSLAVDKLTELMVQTNANVLTFQVKTNQASNFLTYPNKFVNIFNNAKDKYNLASSANGNKAFTSEFKPFGKRTYILNYPDGSIVQGLLAYSSLSEFFSTDLIFSDVDSLMRNTERKLNEDIQELSSKINGIGNKNIKMNAVISDFLTKLGKSVKDKDIVKKYAGNNYQFFIPGYTSLTANGIEDGGLYKKVLYLTTDELADMKRSIGTLNVTGSGAETRSKLKDAFKQILVDYLGDKGAMAAIKNGEKLDYILQYVTGLPTNNSFLKNHSVNDFDNTQKMSDREIVQMQGSFNTSYERLDKAQNNDQLIETQTWGKFFWISEDLLPQ